MKTPLFYHKRPVFGLDIGSQTVKFVQLEKKAKHSIVKAYGSIATDQKIMNSGVITNIPKAAELVDAMLSKNIRGHLTTNRVVMSIPVAHVFTRVLSLPPMSGKELDSAIQLEVEQSVPVASKDLYYDYEITDSGNEETTLVRMVAAPRDIVNSYVDVCDMLGLDLSLVQTNIKADAQLCMAYENVTNDNPYIIVDVGGDSIDVGILDQTLRVTGTVDEGGNSLTQAIAKALDLPPLKANEIKVNQGIGAGTHQKKVKAAVVPILDKVILEIRRMIRFYEERVKVGGEITQIVIVGGGANMPGLGDYLTDATHIPTTVSSPWGKYISFGKLEPPEHADLPRFLTCIGLALVHDEEVFS